jgi:hypothetical protein
VADYYETYAKVYRDDVPEYFVPEADLWEAPLWVAHFSGMLRAIGWDDVFVDLSKVPASPEQCIEAVLDLTRADDWLLFSPLAQNFQLALDVSRALLKRGRRTVIGGNMAGLAAQDDATRVIRGITTPETFVMAIHGVTALAEYRAERRGVIDWIPQYDSLATFGKRVPLLRLNASHGCLYSCTFCGDSWSRKLYLVGRDALAAEVAQFKTFFPDTRLVYIGDKTFGQSPEAVRNLLDVFALYPGYRFIVQTHVNAIDEALVETMQALGVAIVELGFESADLKALRDVGKVFESERQIRETLQLLHRAGLRVVLNVLGGLPGERPESHAKTVSFMEECTDLVWLYNLYNFVPYPLTPLFSRLRARIFDWTYEHWREDAPPVFQPFHISPERSWEYFLEKVATAHRAISCAAPQ